MLLPGEKSLFESKTVGDSSLIPTSKLIALFLNMHHLDLDPLISLNYMITIELGLNPQTRLNWDSVYMSKIQLDLLLFVETEIE